MTQEITYTIIYNSELVLLSDVVDELELLQDCFIFTFAFLVFSLFIALYYCIFSFFCRWRIKMLISKISVK